MADVVTTVHSPIGPVIALPGRIPKGEASQVAASYLRKQIEDAKAHLAEVDNFTTTASRGSVRVRTYEETYQHG